MNAANTATSTNGIATARRITDRKVFWSSVLEKPCLFSRLLPGSIRCSAQAFQINLGPEDCSHSTSRLINARTLHVTLGTRSGPGDFSPRNRERLAIKNDT